MHDDIRIRVVSNKSVSNSSSFVDDNSRTNISWILTALVSRGVDGKYGSSTVIGEKRDMHRLTSSLVFLVWYYAINRRNACVVK